MSEELAVATKVGVPVITEADMNRVGYYTRDGDGAVLLHATNPRLNRHVILIQGAPGVGKSEFAKALSRAIDHKNKAAGHTEGCSYLELLIHSWTSNDDLFAAPHVGNIAVGVKESRDAYRPGILWQAAIQSHFRPVVLLLDEFEKCQVRSEYLFLSWLQDGRVQDSDPDGDGQVIYANLSNIIVVLTSNDTRPLHEATLRRALRYTMQYLPMEAESKLLHRSTGAPIAAIKAVLTAGTKIRDSGSSSPSIQEMGELLMTAQLCTKATDIAVLIKGTLTKTDGCMTSKEIAELAGQLYSAFGMKTSDPDTAIPTRGKATK